MKKKLQIFISSTFTDLISERQSAVEAILRAGHIPAGMELFSASNKSQLEVIKKWIGESDIYVLILGGRYGSIEQESCLSYTELEYQYAFELGKPFFAIVLDETMLNQKVKEIGKNMLEMDNQDKYKKFRENVLSKVCKIVKNETEIKLGIFEAITDIVENNELVGWVKGTEIPDDKIYLSEIEQLRIERDDSLKKIIELERLTKKPTKSMDIGDYSFDEIYEVLKGKNLTLPAAATSDGKEIIDSILRFFIRAVPTLTIGISTRAAGDYSSFLIYKLCPILINFGLVEKESAKTSGYANDKYILSKIGHRFVALYELKLKK